MNIFWKTLLLAAFFVSTLFLVHGDVFLSPDENAAYQFTQQLISHHVLSFPETRNVEVGNVIRARSTAILGDALVPGSFIGLPIIFAIIAAIIGTPGVLLFITPLLATLGIAAWYASVRNIFGSDRLAFFSSVLLAIHPAFWYWTSRAMMHNVAGISCLIFGIFFATREKKSIANLAMSGACIGLALFIRTSEVVWALPIAAVLFFVHKKAYSSKALIACLAALAVCGILTGLANAFVYKAPWETGYTITSSAPTVTPLPSKQETTTAALSFHPRAMLRNVWHYGLSLYPTLSLLALVGVYLVIQEQWSKKDQRYQAFILVTVAVAAALLLMYGGWTTVDNPDPRAVTIGNSHVRYWLPLFVLSSFFGAYALNRVCQKFPRLQYLLLPLFLLPTIALSAYTVLAGGDGIIAAKEVLDVETQKRSAIIDATEGNAVIVVDRADKYLFPYRAVVVPLRDDRTYAAMPAIARLAPLYYFGITLPESDLVYLNTEKLKSLNLRIERVLTINEESLYTIKPSQTIDTEI